MRRHGLALCMLALLALTGCGDFLGKRGVSLDMGGVSFGAGSVKKVYFDFNKYELKASSKEVLLKVVEKLREDKALNVLVIGHTDSRGTEEYNLALGEKRADAVRRFLTECDKSLASRLTVQSKGKAEPEVLVYSSDRKEAERAHAQNRRVVIIMESQSGGVSSADDDASAAAAEDEALSL